MLGKSIGRLLLLCSLIVTLHLSLFPTHVYASKNIFQSKQVSSLNLHVNHSPLTSCNNTNGDDCPPWWSNNPCDSVNHKNGTGIDPFILSDPNTGKQAIYDGIEACGPLPRKIGNSHDYNVSFYPRGP